LEAGMPLVMTAPSGAESPASRASA
jgi:hypothetical protein